MSKLTTLALLVLLCLMSGYSAAAQPPSDSPDDLLYAIEEDDHSYTIKVVNVDSGQITDVGTLHGFTKDAGWSPKGHFIYLSDNSTADLQSLTLFNMDDGNRQLVTDHLLIHCLLTVSWSPDDHYMAYNSTENQTQYMNIYDTETGTQQLLTQSISYNISLVGWSADERFFAYESIDAASQFSTIIWDVEEQRVRYTLDTHSLKWSPVDDRIAYRSSEGDVVILNAADGSERHYAASRFDGWSADGRYALVHTVEDDQTIRVGRIDTQSDEAPLMHAINGTFFYYAGFLWSADKRYLLYQDANTASAAVIDFEDGSGTALVELEHIEPTFTEWSQTGHWIMFPTVHLDLNEPHKSFWVFDLDSQKQHLFDLSSEYVVYDDSAKWSPEGGHMAIWTEEGVVFFSAADWTLHPVANDAPWRSPRWSTDGRYLAFMSGDPESWDVYAVDTQDFQKHNLTNTVGIRETFLGWRGSGKNESLISCGEG